MRVLLNYNKEEGDYLSIVAYIFRSMGIQAASTATTMTAQELVAKAQFAGCSAIVVSNAHTLRNLVPGDSPSLDMWRGSRLQYPVPILIVNSLKHVHTVAHGRWLLERDLAKLAYIHVKPEQFRYTKLLTTDLMNAAYKEMQSAIFIAYDVETKTIRLPNQPELEAGKTLITCASWTAAFKSGALKTWVLPLIDYEGTHWKDDRGYSKAIKFMRNTNALSVPKAMHNGMYDCTHSIVYNCEPHYWLIDTMAMAHAEFSELPKDLSFVASYQLYDYVQWKHDAEDASKKKDQEKYWGYNAKDTWHTARIAIQQLRKSQAYTFTNYKRTFPLVYPSLYGNFEGCKIDEPRRVALRDTAERKLNKARNRLRVLFADEGFNPGSWKQVEFYVYQVFGAKKPKIGKSKSGTDEKNLKAVSEQHPILARLVDEVLDYRESQKAIGTYFDFIQANQRLLWALDPFGTDTSRMACKASSFWCGTQVQNVPSYAKEMLIADEGFEIFEADNKQSEGRTTAYCSQEEALIAALEDATKDFYKTLGTLFFDIPYEEVSDFFRNKVLKRIVHGTNYMMGAGTFIENIGVRILFETAAKLGIQIVEIVRANQPSQRTLRQFAKELLEAYHKPFPRVRAWYKEIYTEIKETGMLVSPLGQVRRFFGNIERDHTMLRSGVAHQPQNVSVEILNTGFKRAYHEICLPSKGDFRLKAQIHDSIFGQWRIERRDEFAKRLADCMYNPVKIHGRTLVIPIDIKHGYRWMEATETVTDGTRKYKGL